MKEVIKWDNNPREMWVWDEDEEYRVKHKVVYIMTPGEVERFKASYTKHNIFPVIALDKDYCDVRYMHCAEL